MTLEKPVIALLDTLDDLSALEIAEVLWLAESMTGFAPIVEPPTDPVATPIATHSAAATHTPGAPIEPPIATPRSDLPTGAGPRSHGTVQLFLSTASGSDK